MTAHPYFLSISSTGKPSSSGMISGISELLVWVLLGLQMACPADLSYTIIYFILLWYTTLYYSSLIHVSVFNQTSALLLTQSYLFSLITSYKEPYKSFVKIPHKLYIPGHLYLLPYFCSLMVENLYILLRIS